MLIYNIFIILFFIATLIVWIIFRIWYKKVYTRERYAFFSSALLFNLYLLVIPYLFGEQTIILIINHLLNLFGVPTIAITFVDFGDKLLIILLCSIFTFYLYNIYAKWSVSTSIRQNELEELKNTTSYLQEAFYALRHWNKLGFYNPKDVSDDGLNIEDVSIEKLAWHRQVAELLTLQSNQYKIDIEKDWYDKESCFISSYGKSKRNVAIFCKIDKPVDAKIYEFIKFVKSEIKAEDILFVVAYKNGSSVNEIIKSSQGVEYWLVSEKCLLDELIDFENYYFQIKNTYQKEPIMSGYKYTIQDIYTEPECTLYEGKNKTFKIESIENYIVEWVNDKKDDKQLALLGEYGQGKSVLSQRLAYKLISSKDLTDRIPIIIELRGKFIKSYNDTLSIFSQWCAKYDINPKALLKLHSAGRLLLIFEGFDEMELVGDYQIRKQHFESLWKCKIPGAKIIITGRPNYFLNDKEQKNMLLTRDTDFTEHYCREIHIQKFDLNRIKDALRSFPSEIKNEIVDVFSNHEKNSSFVDLISRPSSLFLTGIIWKDRNLSLYRDNLNSSTVINEFLLHNYDRQEQKGYNEDFLSREERAFFMQGIAIGMVMKNGYTNQISESDLNAIIKKLYNNFPNKISESNIHKPKTKLKNRHDQKYNEDDIKLDIRSCGILVRDSMTIDMFKFAHKSFLELLVSKYYTIYLLQDNYKVDDLDLIRYRAIKNTLNVVEDNLEQTQDVFQFIMEQCTHDLNLGDVRTPNEKIKVIYKKILRVPIPMNLYFKSMYFFGADLRVGAYNLGGILPFVISLVYIVYRDVESYGAYTYWAYSAYFIALIFFLFFYIRQTRRLVQRFNPLAIFTLLIEKFIIGYLKINNVLFPRFRKTVLFFNICDKYDLLPSLEKMMPAFAFRQIITYSSKVKDHHFENELYRENIL